MKIKKFEDGGQLDLLTGGGAGADILTGTLQSAMGFANLRKANRELSRAQAAAPSLETPAQYYENYKNAYDAELARMQTDSIQSNLSTSIQALQGAGGRALVGGLGASVAQSQNAQNKMLAQERQARMVQGQQLASAEDRTLVRKDARNQQEQNFARQAASAARQNIAGGLTNVATGVMFGGAGQIAKPLIKGGKQALSGVQSLTGLGTDKATGSGLLYSDQDNAFVNNMQDDIDVKRSWELYNSKNAVQKGIMSGVTGPVLPSILEEDSAFSRRAVRNAELKSQETSRAVSPVDATRTENASTSGYMTQEQAYRLGQAKTGQTTPESGFIDPVTGLRVNNPGYNPESPFGIKQYDEGGMMTKGSFSHAKNPINLVQDGKKVGEATGGEYILNPEQAAAVAKESTYARKLFKRFSKKAKKK